MKCWHINDIRHFKKDFSRTWIGYICWEFFINIKFSEETIVKKLDYGDYTLHDEELAVGCYIERKSINDLIGTMSGGLERFKKEPDFGLYFKTYLSFVIFLYPLLM